MEKQELQCETMSDPQRYLGDVGQGSVALERDFDAECGLGNNYDDQVQEDMGSLRSPVLESQRWQVAVLWQESTQLFG